MEFLQGVDIVKLGTIGVIAFGAVYAVSRLKKKFSKDHVDFDSETKLLLHFVFLIVFGLVPVEITNVIARTISNAVAGTLLVTGLYQGSKGIADRIK